MQADRPRSRPGRSDAPSCPQEPLCAPVPPRAHHCYPSARPAPCSANPPGSLPYHSCPVTVTSILAPPTSSARNPPALPSPRRDLSACSASRRSAPWSLAAPLVRPAAPLRWTHGVVSSLPACPIVQPGAASRATRDPGAPAPRAWTWGTGASARRGRGSQLAPALGAQLSSLADTPRLSAPGREHPAARRPPLPRIPPIAREGGRAGTVPQTAAMRGGQTGYPHRIVYRWRGSRGGCRNGRRRSGWW